jgi:hypothetical protein
MREDNGQIYRGDGAKNIARQRHIGINLIKIDTKKKPVLGANSPWLQ